MLAAIESEVTGSELELDEFDRFGKRSVQEIAVILPPHVHQVTPEMIDMDGTRLHIGEVNDVVEEATVDESIADRIDQLVSLPRVDIGHDELGQTAARESNRVTPRLGSEDSDHMEIVVLDVLMDFGEGFFVGGTVAAIAFVHANSLVGGYDSGMWRTL